MQRHPSETENKLLLLHAIDRLGAATAQQLLAFVVENELMDYISLQLGLAELDEAGFLRKQPHALGTLYALTGKGHDALLMFKKRVPLSRLAEIDKNADVWRARFRREKQMLSTFEKKGESDYEVRLRLLERGCDLLDLRVSVPSHEIAQRFADAWETRAGRIYETVMHALGDEEDSSPDKNAG